MTNENRDAAPVVNCKQGLFVVVLRVGFCPLAVAEAWEAVGEPVLVCGELSSRPRLIRPLGVFVADADPGVAFSAAVEMVQAKEPKLLFWMAWIRDPAMVPGWRPTDELNDGPALTDEEVDRIIDGERRALGLDNEEGDEVKS